MATTVKAKTLRVTIQEDIVLNGVNYGSKTKINIPEITEVCKRVVSVATGSMTALLGFGTTMATDTTDYPVVGAFETIPSKSCKLSAFIQNEILPLPVMSKALSLGILK